MAEIFRKSAVENVGGVEQLNKTIVIVSPSFWLAMLGAAGIIGMVTLWAFFGKLEDNVSAGGIFMNREGIHSVYSEIDGTVDSIAVCTGDYIKKGDTIAVLSSQKKINSVLEGTVTELAIVEGQMITAGDYVARLALGDPTDNVVVCYVPVENGRKIKVGMNASVYPSTINKQEYGHMKGTVVYVDQYITSRAVITNQVGVTSLVDSFLEDGPVVEVRLELQKDDNTVSGYWWSSSRGDSIEIVNGTMISADIAVKERHPISLIFPELFTDSDDGR